MVLLCPIAFPIALLLDKILGKDHGTFFRRSGKMISYIDHQFWQLTIIRTSAELRELVKMHGTHQKSNEEPLSYDEVLIVKVNYIISLLFELRGSLITRVLWR